MANTSKEIIYKKFFPKYNSTINKTKLYNYETIYIAYLNKSA